MDPHVLYAPKVMAHLIIVHETLSRAVNCADSMEVTSGYCPSKILFCEGPKVILLDES